MKDSKHDIYSFYYKNLVLSFEIIIIVEAIVLWVGNMKEVFLNFNVQVR